MVDKKGKADMEKDHYCKIIRTGNQKLFFNVTKVTKLQKGGTNQSFICTEVSLFKRKLIDQTLSWR